MPGRLTPLITGQVYHIYNRGIDHRPTFKDKREQERGILALKFYKYPDLPVRLSRFLDLPREERKKTLVEISKKGKSIIDFIAFCLMPNHFHFLLRQNTDKGISTFMSNFQNSFTRFFNAKNQRTGPLFLDQFKAVRTETDEQLLHVSRYIHLNPYSSFIVKSLDQLENYKWSSLGEYIGLDESNFCDKETVLSFFKNKENYKKFLFDQANYQRKLDQIKHLIIDLNP